MYFPLTASIVVKFHQKCSEIPQTLTQFYTIYCFSLILNYLATDKKNMPSSPTIDIFNDLHPDIQKQLFLISKIALLSIIHEDSCNDHVTSQFEQLGLMFSSCSHCKDSKKEFHFLNPKLQEFLAAVYISQLEDYFQEQIFLNHSLDKLHNVWKFVAGLTGLTSPILEVLKSSVHDQQYLPLIISVLYELQDEAVINDIFDEYDSINYSIHYYYKESKDTMLQFCALGYCIAASNSTWNLNFSSCNLNEGDLKAFTTGINSIKITSGSINSLHLSSNLITPGMIQILSEIPIGILQQMTALHLNSCQLTHQCLDNLAMNIIPSVSNLQALNIGNNLTHNHSTVHKLLHTLSSLPKLKELVLEDAIIDFEDIVYLNSMLSMTDTHLTQLSIGGESMQLESMHLLLDTVLSQSFLEELHLSDLDLTTSSNTLILLETNKNLTRLVFFECKLDLILLGTVLCMNTTLRELEVFFPLSNLKSDIGSEETIALSDMLEVNRSLSELSLYSYKPLERSRVICLIETLNYNRSLECLQLPNHYSKNFSTSELNCIDSRVCWKTWPCIH